MFSNQIHVLEQRFVLAYLSKLTYYCPIWKSRFTFIRLELLCCKRPFLILLLSYRLRDPDYRPLLDIFLVNIDVIFLNNKMHTQQCGGHAKTHACTREIYQFIKTTEKPKKIDIIIHFISAHRGQNIVF